ARQPAPSRPVMSSSAPVARPAPAAKGPIVIGGMRAPKAAPAPNTPPASLAALPMQARSGARPAAVPARPGPAVSAPTGGASRPPLARAGAENPMSAAAKAAQAPAAPLHGTTPSAGASSKAGATGALPNSNVREVLKALDDAAVMSEATGATRMMPA